MHLKGSREEYMGGLREGEGKGELSQLLRNLEN